MLITRPKPIFEYFSECKSLFKSQSRLYLRDRAESPHIGKYSIRKLYCESVLIVPSLRVRGRVSAQHAVQTPFGCRRRRDDGSSAIKFEWSSRRPGGSVGGGERASGAGLRVRGGVCAERRGVGEVLGAVAFRREDTKWSRVFLFRETESRL